jgi:hypothetical protein
LLWSIKWCFLKKTKRHTCPNGDMSNQPLTLW